LYQILQIKTIGYIVSLCDYNVGFWIFIGVYRRSSAAKFFILKRALSTAWNVEEVQADR
jgi:hypothetical protein